MSTLYAWDQEGRIPQPIRIGVRTYWRGDELRDWIDAGCPCRERWNLLRKEA
jgi:predicted DNA-binding transcriptional regulator AlpA